MTPETYARQEYNLMTEDIAERLKLGNPDVVEAVAYFDYVFKNREQKRAVILQELLGRVAGCLRTPASCNYEAPGDHTRWCMACLLRYGMGIEFPGIERG
jgi:hypothetical protein